MKIKPIHIGLGLGALFLFSKGKGKKGAQPATPKQEISFDYPASTYVYDPMAEAKQRREEIQKDVTSRRAQQPVEEGRLDEAESFLATDLAETVQAEEAFAEYENQRRFGRTDPETAKQKAMEVFRDLKGADPTVDEVTRMTTLFHQHEAELLQRFSDEAAAAAKDGL